MATGTVTVTAAANVDVTGSALTLATKDATAITWSAVVPGNYGLDTNRTLLIWHQVFYRHKIRTHSNR